MEKIANSKNGPIHIKDKELLSRSKLIKEMSANKNQTDSNFFKYNNINSKYF